METLLANDILNNSGGMTKAVFYTFGEILTLRI